MDYEGQDSYIDDWMRTKAPFRQGPFALKRKIDERYSELSLGP